MIGETVGRSNLIVTGNTVGGPQFQFADVVADSFHKSLVADVPGHSDCGEDAPTIPVGKVLTSGHTRTGFNHIPVIIAVCSTGHHALLAVGQEL